MNDRKNIADVRVHSRAALRCHWQRSHARGPPFFCQLRARL